MSPAMVAVRERFAVRVRFVFAARAMDDVAVGLAARAMESTLGMRVRVVGDVAVRARVVVLVVFMVLG